MIPAPAVPGKNTRNAAGENKGTVLLFPSPCFAYEHECKWTETKEPSPFPRAWENRRLYPGGKDDIIEKISRTAK